MTHINAQLKIKRQRRHFYVSSIITVILVVVIAVFATLIANRIPWTFDMTAGKVFTLSSQSEQILEALSEPVEIIAVYPTGGADPMISSLLREYEKFSSYLKVEFVDIEKDPTRLSVQNLGVSAVGNGTIVVRTANQIKLLTASNMFRQTQSGTAFLGERELTGAIRYVTADLMPVVYFLEGHEEAATSGELAQARAALELEVYNVQSLSLVKTGKVPDDAALLIIASPKRDLSESEAEMLEDYLRKGGKALFLIDALSTNTAMLGRFNEITRQFGIDISNNVVIEEDPSAYSSNNKFNLIPGYAYHNVTRTLAENKRYVILPVVMGLRTVDFNPEEVKLELLLASTIKSFMRTDMQVSLTEKSDTDISGPIPLAYVSTRLGSGWGGDARIIVIGNSTFVYDANIEAYANRDFFLNCIGWLTGGRDEYTISPRIIGGDKLIVRGNDFIRLIIITLVVLPAIPFIGAAVLWYLRRNQ
jgi:ABC-2 type transport system permease protein